MLRREVAQEQLKAFQSDPDTRRERPRHGTGSPAASLERWLDEPRSGWATIGQELDGLGPRELTHALEAVRPELGGALARWWTRARTGPYQQGWARRGFRSDRASDTLTNRTDRLWELLHIAGQWPQDAAWFATWLSHLPNHTGPLSGVLASEIDAGREDIAETLVASAHGRHPVSGTTQAGIGALLGSDRPDLWEQVADLLRTAGRQEGLRTAVLEAVDLAHPDAFLRVLDVVVAEDLVRFAGTVRAAGVWFGEELTVRTSGELGPVLAQLAAALRDPTAADRPGSPVETFVRLTALAHGNAHLAIPRAADLLASPQVEMRRVAARLLAELGLVRARDALRPALADPDLAVYATAVSAWPTSVWARDRDARLGEPEVAVLLERARTLGKPRTVETGVIGSRPVEVGSAHAADVVLANASSAAPPPEALAAATADGRAGAVRRMAVDPVTHRAALFAFVTDPSSMVRSVAHEALAQGGPPTAPEAALLVDALRRKAGDVRRFALSLLLRQPADAVAASVAALAAGTAEQRRAAEELAGAAAPAAADDTDRPDGSAVPAALRPAPADRTPAVRPPLPQKGWFDRYQPGCMRIVTSLRAWLDEHADVEVETRWDGVQLLGNLQWLPPARPGSTLPLPEVVGPWWERTSPSLTDGGVEMLLLVLAVPRVDQPWARTASARVVGTLPADVLGSRLVRSIVKRLASREFRASWTDIALDAATAVRADLPLSAVHAPAETARRLGNRGGLSAFRPGRRIDPMVHDARDAFAEPSERLPLDRLGRDQLARAWHLARFVDEPEGTADVRTGPTVPERTAEWDGRERVERVPDQPWRYRPPLELLCRCFDAGVARRGDLVEALLPVGDLDLRGGQHPRHRSSALHDLSARRPPAWGRSTAVQSVVQEARAAVIAGEVERGELPGPLTPVAQRLRSATGIPSVVRVLGALGRRPFARGYSFTESRDSSLSHLVRVHTPAPDETAEALTAALAAAGVTEKRAVEFAVYAPQWAGLVESSLGRPGLESAVWWLHAHTKDESWYVDAQIREEWASAVSQRTPLDSVDLVRGAADVQWFRSVVAELGVDGFTEVLAAAKYASSAGGHKRAELFASALLGRLDEADLVGRIRTKRHQDAVRALGLLPLEGRHDPRLLARYQVLAGFVASDRTSGSQRRASEATAVAVGLENLARSAGHRDPGRLTWAMEAEAVRDLAAGPVTVSEGDVTVALSLDDAGAPLLRVERAGRVLKAVPAATAKVPAVAELKGRVTGLRQQATRMRRSLEASCITGERFEADEVADLLRHPVLAPMLRDLVLVSDEGVTGFPSSDDPGVLLGPAGTSRPLDGSDLRIAHPVDLLAGGEWPDLQHALFAAQRSQPFKQLFRELYVPTGAETTDGALSRRYAGHQVDARRAAGIFTGRGWVADFEVGFGRTFHAEKLTAWCSVLGGAGTAAEVEDTTVEEVTFVRAGSWDVVPVAEVPPRLFSEAMRDLDLVVSVAHSGGVDPGTSESSVEVRRRLVEETTALLGLENVETTEHHARIRGVLGSYSVQLGSGVVHRLPGGSVCIIPVSAQHRGRVFLPFADDDPRTAEVLSKVLLLARDDRIRDPSILEQLT